VFGALPVVDGFHGSFDLGGFPVDPAFMLSRYELPNVAVVVLPVDFAVCSCCGAGGFHGVLTAGTVAAAAAGEGAILSKLLVVAVLLAAAFDDDN
jgi:hypothetical protein